MERKTFPELSHNGPVCLKRYHLCHGSVREKSTTPMFLDVIKGILFFMCSVDFQTPPPPFKYLIPGDSAFLGLYSTPLPLSFLFPAHNCSLTPQGSRGRPVYLEVQDTRMCGFGNVILLQ